MECWVTNKIWKKIYWSHFLHDVPKYECQNEDIKIAMNDSFLIIKLAWIRHMFVFIPYELEKTFQLSWYSYNHDVWTNIVLFSSNDIS